jgi:predicted nucleic acid-binding protein
LPPIAIVDAAPLYAAIDNRDAYHSRALAQLERADIDIVIPALVVAEVCHFLGQRMTAAIEAAFLRGLALFDVEAPTPDEWTLIADLVERYGNFPLGGTDASVMVLAERYQTDLVVTFDERHFRTIPMRDGRPFHLLPE